MARRPRCLVDDVDLDAPTPSPERRRHVERVLRVRDGDAVELIDGRGGFARAAWRRDGAPEIVERAPRRPPPHEAITLAIGSPRLPRLEWLVEKAVELGVTEIVPVELRHAERTPGDGRVERLRRKAEEALLQCRGLHATTIAAPTSLAEVLTRPWASIWVGVPPASGEPGGAAEPPPAPSWPLLVVVGPEGGLADDETDAVLAAGGRPVSLGPRVLRVETAAIALVTLSYAAR